MLRRQTKQQILCWSNVRQRSNRDAEFITFLKTSAIILPSVLIGSQIPGPKEKILPISSLGLRMQQIMSQTRTSAPHRFIKTCTTLKWNTFWKCKILVCTRVTEIFSKAFSALSNIVLRLTSNTFAALWKQTVTDMHTMIIVNKIITAFRRTGKNILENILVATLAFDYCVLH